MALITIRIEMEKYIIYGEGSCKVIRIYLADINYSKAVLLYLQAYLRRALEVFIDMSKSRGV